MLEVASSAEETRLGVDFADVYRRSNLFQYVQFPWNSIDRFYISVLVQLSFSLFNHFVLSFNRRNKLIVERLSKPSSDSKELNFPTKYSQSFLDQFLACLWKQNLSYWRNPQYTAVRFFYTVIISLMFGTICWGFGSKRSVLKLFLPFFSFMLCLVSKKILRKKELRKMIFLCLVYNEKYGRK